MKSVIKLYDKEAWRPPGASLDPSNPLPKLQNTELPQSNAVPTCRLEREQQSPGPNGLP